MKIELSESRGVVRGGKQFNRHSWTSVKAVVAAVLWTIFGVTAVAQGIFGRISGTVTDSQGAVVAGVRIRIVNEETKLERATTTDANGYYVASDLPVGVYSVFAEQFGFKTVKKTGNDLVAGARMSVDLSLVVGEVSQRVEVAATAETINTTSGELARVIPIQPDPC